MTTIQTLLERGVDKVYPSREFLEKRLAEGKPLKVYWGVDPTGEMQLHHVVPLMKLKHFQDLGHKVYILIGSFTAMIGDPTGKTKTRVPLTKEQVVENAKKYAEHARRILDFDKNPPEIVFNGDWLEKLSFKEIVQLASHFTVQQMLERDMFQERVKSNLPISLHEFLYPLMQGYDSVALDVDVEIGGTDQTFNMLAGRKLIENYLHKEKCVVATPLVVDSSGKKMSTSDGSGIPLDASAEDMFGKIMSLQDEIIMQLFLLMTDYPDEKLNEMESAMKNGENPINYKKQLAFEITKLFHGEQKAADSKSYFESVVQNDELPADIPEWIITSGLHQISDLVFDTGLVDSRSDAKRMVNQGAVAIIEEGAAEKRITDPHTFIEVKNGMVIRVGKRRYLKLKV